MFELSWELVHKARHKVYDLLASMAQWVKYDEKDGVGLKPPGEPSMCVPDNDLFQVSIYALMHEVQHRTQADVGVLCYFKADHSFHFTKALGRRIGWKRL